MANGPDPNRPLTLIQVAQMLGVSKSTVSAAFTGRGTITAARREQVKRAAVELGYEPNPHAQRLVRGARSEMVCIYTPPLAEPFARVIDLLQWAIVEWGGIPAPIHIAGNYRGEMEYQVSVLRGLRLQRPRAMVCCLRNLLPELRAELKQFMTAGGILIGADGFESEDIGSDWVRFDGAHNSYLATRYLLENGHTKIGFYMASPARWVYASAENPEYQGFWQAHREYGLTPRDDWFIRKSYYEDGGMELARAFLALDDRPTAMFVINDNAASAFVQQLYRAGLRVPEDVSVVGHDDVPAAAACITPLTTVSWPVQAMVDRLKELLLSRIDDGYDGPRRAVVVRGELVVRESVAPLS